MDIANGKYAARAETAEFGTSDKGSDFIAVDFVFDGGEYHGKHITAWLYFTDKTTARSIESLRYCGCTFPNNDLTNLEGLGRTLVQLVIENETYNGVTRAKVQWVNSLGSAMKSEQKMNAAAKSSFKDRMKAHLIASQVSDVANAKVDPKDSDIPF